MDFEAGHRSTSFPDLLAARVGQFAWVLATQYERKLGQSHRDSQTKQVSLAAVFKELANVSEALSDRDRKVAGSSAANPDEALSDRNPDEDGSDCAPPNERTPILIRPPSTRKESAPRIIVDLDTGRKRSKEQILSPRSSNGDSYSSKAMDRGTISLGEDCSVSSASEKSDTVVVAMSAHQHTDRPSAQPDCHQRNTSGYGFLSKSAGMKDILLEEKRAGFGAWNRRGSDASLASSSSSGLSYGERRETASTVEKLRMSMDSMASMTYEIHPVWRNRIAAASKKTVMGGPVPGKGKRLSLESKLFYTGTAKPYLLPPTAPLRSMLDVFGLLLITYDTFRSPMIFLDLPEDGFTEIATWVIRIFWTVDFGLNLITGYIRKDGLSEMRWKKIIKHYAETWMIPDVVLVTMDWMEVLAQAIDAETGIARLGKSTRVTRTFRTLRLFRVVRMGKVAALVNKQALAIGSETLLVVLDILKIMVCLSAFTHATACVWYGFGIWQSRHGTQTWLQQSELVNLAVGDCYLESFRWAMAQFAGGADFVRPQNLDERIFGAALVLVCFFIAAAVVSLLTSATTKLLLISSGPARQLAKLRNYLAQNRVSQSLMVRIQRNAQFIVYEKQRRLPEEDVEVLVLVSEPLRMEMHLEIRSPLLTEHPFFHRHLEVCPAGMRDLCSHAVFTKLMAPGDVAFRAFEEQPTPQMLFVAGGNMTYQHDDVYTLKVHLGEWLAEGVLWTEWTHRGTLIASSECRVLALDAKKFQKCVKRFDAGFLHAEAYARDFVQQLNQTRSEDVTDLDMDHHAQVARAHNDHNIQPSMFESLSIKSVTSLLPIQRRASGDSKE